MKTGAICIYEKIKIAKVSFLWLVVMIHQSYTILTNGFLFYKRTDTPDIMKDVDGYGFNMTNQKSLEFMPDDEGQNLLRHYLNANRV